MPCTLFKCSFGSNFRVIGVMATTQGSSAEKPGSERRKKRYYRLANLLEPPSMSDKSRSCVAGYDCSARRNLASVFEILFTSQIQPALIDRNSKLLKHLSLIADILKIII